MDNGSARHSDLLILIEKYMNNTCSKEELQQILDLAKEGSDEFMEALKAQWSNAQEDSDADYWGGMFQSMLGSARKIELANQQMPSVGKAKVHVIGGRTRKFFIRYAAAAAIVLLLLTAGLFILRKPQREVAQTQQGKERVKDIAPGGDRAVLTLANGQKIILDTASNGAVALQGGRKVIKIGGQLSYNSETTSTEVLYNTISTPKGGQYQLELADGTKVWLNAASSLRFPTSFTGKDRTVELSGEGYFEVAHNANMPFHVKVNSVDRPMDVTVLGTHFNINSYADEPNVKTTLLEGRVRVTKGEKYVFLNPEQQASTEDNSPSIRVINDVDVDEVVAWKNGLIQFSGADLGTVMRNIGRWYNVDVNYTNVESAHLSGKVSRNLNLSQVIKVLQASGIDIKMEGNRLVATPRP